MANTYDPQKVIVDFGGFLLTGFADGTFIEAARNADSFGLTVGADGSGARAKSADRSGTVKLTLLQTAAGNDYLSACLAADELTGLGGKPLMVKDAFGTTLVASTYAWIKKPADTSFSKEIEGREWTLETDQLAMLVGGALI